MIGNRKLKALVLGRGFIGFHLAKRLRNQGLDVFTYSRKASVDASFNSQVDWTGDFFNLEPTSPILCEDFDVIFHLISSTTPASAEKDITFDLTSNLLGTIDFINKIRRPEKTKLIFISSAGTIYGPSSTATIESSPTNPNCSYGVTKLAVEKHLSIAKKNLGLDYLVLRVSNPYGPWSIGHSPFGIINNFVDHAYNGKPLTVIGDLETERDFIYIEDLVQAIEIAALSRNSKEVYNLSCGISSSLDEVLNIMRAEFSVDVQINYQPARSFDLKRVLIDNSLFKNEFSWKPRYSIENGVKKLITWRRDVDHT